MEALKTDKLQTLNWTDEIGGEHIHALRDALGMSLREFGVALARAINPYKRPFSKQYVSALEKGKSDFVITPEIRSAIWDLLSRFDDVPAGIGGAQTISVIAMPGQFRSGVYISPDLTERLCATPWCQVRYIGRSKYHNGACERSWRNYVRRQKRKK